jgi:hypothetical protein
MKWMSRKHRWKCLIIMVAPGRVELPTFGLGNRCSIHLSYGAGANSPHYLTSFYRHNHHKVRSSGFWRQIVHSKIEFQHVDPRFPE